MSNYSANDIQTLSFREAVRSKLGMYLSADQQEAMQLGLRELIYNTRDEYEQGYGNKAIITIDVDKNKITLEDNARGSRSILYAYRYYRYYVCDGLAVDFTLAHTCSARCCRCEDILAKDRSLL